MEYIYIKETEKDVMKRLKSLIVENIVEEIQRKGVTEQVMQRLMEQYPPIGGSDTFSGIQNYTDDIARRRAGNVRDYHNQVTNPWGTATNTLQDINDAVEGKNMDSIKSTLAGIKTQSVYDKISADLGMDLRIFINNKASRLGYDNTQSAQVNPKHPGYYISKFFGLGLTTQEDVDDINRILGKFKTWKQ